MHGFQSASKGLKIGVVASVPDYFQQWLGNGNSERAGKGGRKPLFLENLGRKFVPVAVQPKCYQPKFSIFNLLKIKKK
jgi:hypothetical protein